MKQDEVLKKRLLAMPLRARLSARPLRSSIASFSSSPTDDPEKLRAARPEPLVVEAPLVKYEFIPHCRTRPASATTRDGQVIRRRSTAARRLHALHVPHDEPPIPGGRELWDSRKARQPSLHARIDTLVGHARLRPVRVATGTWAQHREATRRRQGLVLAPNFLLKIIPTWTARAHLQLVEYYLEDITSRAPGPARRAVAHPARARPGA